MLVACRLAGLSALEGHHAGLNALPQQAHMRQGDPFAHNQPNGWPCGAQLNFPSRPSGLLTSAERRASIGSAQCPGSGEPWNGGSTLSLLAASLRSPLRWPSIGPRTCTTAGTMASRFRRGSRPSAAGRMMSITFVPSRSDGTRLATMRATSIPSRFRRVWRCQAKTASTGCSSTRTTALGSRALDALSRRSLLPLPAALQGWPAVAGDGERCG
jgi:hypothetical protein